MLLLKSMFFLLLSIALVHSSRVYGVDIAFIMKHLPAKMPLRQKLVLSQYLYKTFFTKKNKTEIDYKSAEDTRYAAKPLTYTTREYYLRF